MIQKQTYVSPADRCGVWWASVFHLYKGSYRKISFAGDFVKVSIKLTRPQNWLKKKTKLKGIIIRTKKEIHKIDGSFVRFNNNNVVLLKRRLTPMGKSIYGPIVKNINRKKFISSFSGVL